jgi:hypothetical protein
MHSLVVKRFLFEAFDCYIALFYIAFVQCDVVRLRVELVSLYTSDSLRRIVTETLLPMALEKGAARSLRQKHSQAKKTDAVNDKQTTASLSLMEELDLQEYEQFDDYLEMVIEFGYVTLFASAFPLAALLSVACNLVEMKSDLFKLSWVCRRPLATSTPDIGVWEGVLSSMVWMCLLTNCLIFSFTSDQMEVWLPWLFTDVDGNGEGEMAIGSGRYVVGLCFALEHALILVVMSIQTFVPAVPEPVAVELKRREHVKQQTLFC